ncbi:MAG: HAD family hydrolase [Thiomicrospira sp.]|uniref:HAD family hydrolase n=1 Tax=Thiomicrospira sp. TaxID=935 RepID=UPI0019DCDB18|nr:HAD hydrolase-like protein [Thiomicrospira sp.]MBE0494394.1 HAD family hydrolase [Thiomicrospira sp.]
MKTTNNKSLILDQYKTFVFDCDGVVLNSNKIKTQAFYDVARIYGHEPAQALKDYHVQNGGISRYAKFEYLLTNILKKQLDPEELSSLLQRFASEVKKALLNCEVAEGLDALKEQTINAKWMIVSGGDQAELREVFLERRLDKLFDGGIFGSPDTKDTILKREIIDGNINNPALFLGDSKYDYQASDNAGLDFVFISDWTEVQSWENWASKRHLNCVSNIYSLVKS